MSENFTTYKKFPTQEQARQLTALLEQHAVPYQLEDHSNLVPQAYLGTQPGDKIEVKIRAGDFAYVNSLLHAEAESELQNVDPGHYLFGFSDDELREIIMKQDEWSQFDFLLARKILRDRGIIIPDEKIEDAKQKRMQELSQPEPSPMKWLITGYIISISSILINFYLSAKIPGLFGNILVFGVIIIGPAIGYHIATSKRILPDGSKKYMFSAKDRLHGWAIFLIGLIMAIAFLVMVYLFAFNFWSGRLW